MLARMCAAARAPKTPEEIARAAAQELKWEFLMEGLLIMK